MKDRLIRNALISFVLLITSCSASKTNTVDLSSQKGFATPEEAIVVLAKSAKSQDLVMLDNLFGRNFTSEVASGDSKQDSESLANLAKRLSDRTELIEKDQQELLLNIGQDNFLFPVPLVKINQLWYFDGLAGVEEILNRRIGHNEISAIKVLDFFNSAQKVYASKDRDGDGQLEYAERLLSTPGKQDGLYWNFSTFKEPSPLGPQIARSIKLQGEDGIYNGYNYKIISSPNDSSNITKEVVLFAYPARYGISGVMSFLTGGNGKVYQKNINTAEGRVSSVTPFIIDDSWQEVEL